MALISAFTIIRAISLFHLTAAYIFLTSPRTIADQNVVYVLGEAIRVPHVTSLDKPNEASAFIAILFAFIGLADLTAASLNEEIAIEYWLSNVPVRLLFLFGLTGYVYLFKEDGLLGSSAIRQEGAGELIRNSMVFTWAFVETAAWFWIFTSLRDERREMVRRRLEKLRAEEDRL
ncbi:uncharacterized protein LTR77_002264 [Saxophila tyrrhenica]|uniref:Increased loss of mitochondrial DNA protein 1 n=1 Tax=Saxophila tyrrhenica TaxID=1690608 RepID=A0AAV9PJ08_9PEZI|nr:hypothetical protein LTR77_002264 [Saxophila tyrrhenica]